MSKVIVITGAGLGLGKTLAVRFAADGDTVVLLGRTASKVEAVAEQIGARAVAIGCDVSSPDQVDAAFAAIAARFGKIDVLINNAAIYEASPLATASDEHILSVINTNLLGPILCARAAIPLLRRSGQIINVSSESVEIPFAHLVLYQTSKAGLEGFSVNLARELEPEGIRVCVVRAGQMIDEEKVFTMDPAAAMALAQACLERGINLMQRPFSHFRNISNIFRALVDLSPDIHIAKVEMHARAQNDCGLLRRRLPTSRRMSDDPGGVRSASRQTRRAFDRGTSWVILSSSTQRQASLQFGSTDRTA